jgi:hypothetical protein
LIAICPTCGEKGKLPAHLAGLRIKCKKCSTTFVATAPGSPAAAPAGCETSATKRDGIEVDGLDESSWSSTPDAIDPAPEPGKVASLFTVSPLAEPPQPEPAAAGTRQYKVLTPKDKWFENKFDLARLEEALNFYAKQGWVVRSMATPQIAGFSGGLKEELVILLERSIEI